MTIDEIKTLYDSLCTPMDSYLGAVEQVQARHLLASKAFPFLVKIAKMAETMALARNAHACERPSARDLERLDPEGSCYACDVYRAIRVMEEAKL